MTERNITVLGGGGVGKSSLSIRYCFGHMPAGYSPTIEDSFRKQTEIDGDLMLLQILDTAGQEEFVMMRDQWIRSADAFIVVFSVTDRRSFEGVDEIVHAITRARDVESAEGVPIVCVANKADAVGEERVVSADEAADKVRALACAQYVEASAKDNINVADCFEHAMRVHRRLVPESPEKSKLNRERRRRLGMMCPVL